MTEQEVRVGQVWERGGDEFIVNEIRGPWAHSYWGAADMWVKKAQLISHYTLITDHTGQPVEQGHHVSERK